MIVFARIATCLARFTAVARQLSTLAVLCLVVGNGAAAADAWRLSAGTRVITLVAADGTRLPIGRLTLAARDGGAFGIVVNVDAPQFEDQFLSMRPFRCLTQGNEMWCHLPYPYETRGEIRDGDLVDLEYALLFLFKPPTAYGIDAWNGLYFKLGIAPDGAIVGAAHETNLDVLATPPDDRSARMIGAADLTPVAPTAHAFARVEIK